MKCVLLGWVFLDVKLVDNHKVAFVTKLTKSGGPHSVIFNNLQEV